MRWLKHQNRCIFGRYIKISIDRILITYRLRWAGHIIRGDGNYRLKQILVADSEIAEPEWGQILDVLMMWTRTLKHWNYDADELEQGKEIIGELWSCWWWEVTFSSLETNISYMGPNLDSIHDWSAKGEEEGQRVLLQSLANITFLIGGNSFRLFFSIILKIYSTPDMWQTFSKVFRYLEILRAPFILSIYQCFKY